ncbi:saccharopine dehydrogenase family protein [Jatrophihabitans sp. YIM 134969]
MTDREHDLVVHGATGFVGALTARHLADHAPADVRIALSGRSRDKLEAVRRDLGVDWPLVVTDSGDDASVRALAGSTTAVISTVGPYAKYGLPLVLACAGAGTSYADLTGEVLFARESVDRAHMTARETGARIVHSAGFDSIPSDLSVFALHERAAADGAGTLTDTVLEVVSMRGGVSGGTIDSMRGQVDVVRSDKAKRKIALDPFALSADRAADPAAGDRTHRDVVTPLKDPLLGRWVAPFVMSSYNTRVVRRSNSLLDHAYGPDFHYREVMNVGDGLTAPVVAAGISAGVGALAGGLALPPTRWVLDRVLPKPGEGPSVATQQKGRFRVATHTVTTTGARYTCTVAASGDPGYAATAVMLGQSGLSLAVDELTSEGGVLTPAVAMGDALISRLRERGFEIEVREG